MIVDLVQPLTRPILSSLSDAITSVFSGFNPSTLFSAYSGAYWDTTDVNALAPAFIVGNYPKTILGSQASFLADKSSGYSSAAELVPDSTFDDPSKWTSGGAAWTISDGKATYNDTGLQYIQVTPAIAINSGDWFVFRMTFSGSSGQIVLGILDNAPSVHYFGGGYQTLQQGNGEYVFAARASDIKNGFRIYGNDVSASSWSLESFSAKRVSGNHLFQGTAANSPYISADAAQFVAFNGTSHFLSSPTGGGSTSGFFYSAGIRITGGAGTSRTIWSDAGTNTGVIVGINASNQLYASFGNGSAYTTVTTTETLPVGTDTSVSVWYDGSAIYAQVGLNSPVSTAFSTLSAGSSAITVGRSNTAATNYAAIRLYPSIYIKDSAMTSPDRANAIRYCYSKATGVSFSVTTWDYDIFLVGGQSNAVGVGNAAESVSVPFGQGVEYQNDGSFDSIADPTDHAFGSKSTTGSMWPAFCAKYFELTGRRALIVSAARSGEGLTNGQWSTTNNILLPHLGNKYDAAVLKLTNNGAVPKSRAFFWLGGESDAGAGVSKATFKTAFIDLLSRARTEIGDASLPIYCISIDSTSVVANQSAFATIRTAQAEACDETAGMEMVLPYQGYYDAGKFSDSLHWNQEALNDAGQKVAVATAALLFP